MSEESTKDVKEKKPKMVSLPEETVKDLLSRLDRLEYAASKANLANFDAKNKGDFGKEAKVSVYDGKVISAWKMVEDIVEKNPTTGVWTEKQVIELYFSDGSSEKMPYQQFVRRVTKRNATVLEETTVRGGNETWRLRTIPENPGDEAVDVELDVRFIN